MADAYVGRFAPTPSGPLHFGSLIAAVASYLCAKAAGRWFLRVEDLDPPREAPGAVSDILTTLDRFGFEWDGEVEYQSDHHDRFQHALDRLIRDGHAYPCGCTRKEILESVGDSQVYPGTCRDGLPPGKEPRAWRVRTTAEPVEFDDRVFGHFAENLDAMVGDFVIKRADGFWAYQLAVVVDDAAQGVTDIVRGADLLDSTTRQIHLQRLLGLPTPTYLHVPVAVGEDGKKLSKSLGAVPLSAGNEPNALWHALAFLGQDPPVPLQDSGLDAVWRWAKENWNADRIPRSRTIQV